MKALTKEVRFCAGTNCKKKKKRHVNFGVFPCQNYRSESRCTCGDKCRFRHVVEAEEKPSKKSKKGGAKGSVALLKEFTQLGCVSQDSHPKNSILREPGKLGSKYAVKHSKGTWHQIKIVERKGPSQRNHPKVCAS